MNAQAWVVHKFGGTSVMNAERIAHVADLVTALPESRVAVVVSAMSGITDALLRVCAQAVTSWETANAGLSDILARHHTAIDALVTGAVATSLHARIEQDAHGLRDLLRAAQMLQSHPETLDEVVAGHGEVWCAQLLAARLGCLWMDARKTLVVRAAELGPMVDWDVSRARVHAYLSEHEVGAGLMNGKEIVVVTGYVASTPEGVPTTLKRNGSDFSASIFGALLDARDVTIWTDVDGVMSADPRRVHEAIVLDEMSYEEAMELAYFGAKVVHPRTMQPVVDRGIPIWIKNTFRPHVRGTVIQRARSVVDKRAPAVKGFTTIEDIALVSLEGTGMVGVPGIAERLFGALRAVGVSVVVISQASSEHSICFAVPEKQSALAEETVTRAFMGERAQGLVSTTTVQHGCAILAAVGDAMAERPGVSGRFFSALGDVGVNVRAVAQGSSERNITAVIDAKDSTRALRAVHARFLLSDLTLAVGVVGPGLIGRALVQQLQEQRDELRKRFGVDLQVRAVTDSQHMIHGDDVKLSDLASGAPANLDAFTHLVRPEHSPHAVIVDCSASDLVADHYASWLRAGIHVVTPNKRAASGPHARWRDIQDAVRQGHARYLGEATVGAGLPIMTTLKDLLLTGDHVLAVEGVLSGTLSFIFNTLGSDEKFMTFSSCVREAKRLGYTEPDPREDLSGQDFARKLVVLARALGRDVELADVVIEDLAPGLPFGAPLEELLRELVATDSHIAQRQRTAHDADCVLRYAGTIPETGPPRVELRAVPRTHAFASLVGTDNVVAFRTRRYHTQPLIVRGPGAGPDVTASGVFGDVLRLASHLGAKL
jgi:aspartokinase/homoserine dehydrogenase 1